MRLIVPTFYFLSVSQPTKKHQKHLSVTAQVRLGNLQIRQQKSNGCRTNLRVFIRDVHAIQRALLFLSLSLSAYRKVSARERVACLTLNPRAVADGSR